MNKFFFGKKHFAFSETTLLLVMLNYSETFRRFLQGLAIVGVFWLFYFFPLQPTVFRTLLGLGILYDTVDMLNRSSNHRMIFILFIYGLGSNFIASQLYATDRLRTYCTVMLVCASDTFQYFFGKLFGKTKIFKSISSKSLEGYVGGIIGTVCFGLIIRQSVLRSVIISCAGIVGDMLESYLKRKIKIKDTSTLFGSHGGWFDRADGIYASLWVMWIFSTL